MTEELATATARIERCHTTALAEIDGDRGCGSGYCRQAFGVAVDRSAIEQQVKAELAHG